MGSIIFTGIEILVMGIGLYTFPFFILVLMTIFFLFYLYFGFKIKKVIYYILPILFLIRIFFSVNFSEINSENIIMIETNIAEGKGRIEKLENKFPLKNIYISVENISDGRYIFYGKAEKVSKEYEFYNFQVLEENKIPLNKFQIFFDKKLNNLKKYISNRCGNFLEGVILGERRYIYKDIREKFAYCGVAHLLAISGLHIGIVIGIILSVLKTFKIKKEKKNLIALIFLSFYMLGILGSPSSFRAYIMGAIFLLGNMFYEKIDIKKSFALAIIINFFIYPTSFSNISFVFSYMCLFSIIYIYPRCRILKKSKYKNILNFFIMIGVIQIFITPISFYFFKTVPLFSYLTNFILTPLGTVFIIFGFVSFFVPEIIFKIIIAPILQGVYDLIEKLLNIFVKIPYLAIKCDINLSLKFIIFIYIMLIILFYKKSLSNKK